MPIQIISHALKMVFGDLGASLKVTGLLYVLAQLSVILPPLIFLGTYDALDPLGLNQQVFNPAFFAFAMIGFVVSIILSTWMAVAWHRYVLLGETGLSYPSGKVGSYFWTGLGYGLMIMVPLIVVSIALFAFLGQGLAEGALVQGLLTGFATYFFLRIAMGLPGLCVDKNIRFGESWKMTAKLSGALAGVAVIAGVAGALVAFALVNVGGGIVITLVFGAILGWLQWVVSLSVLTTVYGVVVEGRELT